MSAPAGNWKSGAFRIWVVASVVWVAGMGWVQFSEPAKNEPQNINIMLSPSAGLQVQTNAAPEDADVSECDRAFGDKGGPIKLSAVFHRGKEDCVSALSEQHHKYLAYQAKRFSAVILPPLLLLLVFPVVAWVRRGFKPA